MVINAKFVLNNIKRIPLFGDIEDSNVANRSVFNVPIAKNVLGRDMT